MQVESLETRNVFAINVTTVQDNSAGDTGGFVATGNQRNDGTFFDSNATLVDSFQVDTLAELNAFDVVTVGHNDYGGIGYTGTNDAQAQGATGSAVGVAGDPLANGSSLNVGASFTDAPGDTANWTFFGEMY